MTPKLPTQIKDMAYRGFIQPAARLAMAALVAFVLGSVAAVFINPGWLRSDGGGLFFALLALGFGCAIGRLVPPLFDYWISQARRHLSKHD